MTSEEISAVRNAIAGAYRVAVGSGIHHDDAGRCHGLRSRALVVNAINELRAIFLQLRPNGNPIGVLGKGVGSNVPGLQIKNEYLFDVHAFEYEVVPSPYVGAPICLVRGSLVQLESEVDRGLTEVTTDFNKLVCGRADLKVMIISKHDWTIRGEFLTRIAARISDPLLLFVIPHPKEWHQAAAADQLQVKRFTAEYLWADA
ncbi:MAG: hypothetical protein HY553_14655 [Elusimicrobia bacterium]|nr:hypothetical protein [Elusimicrobiota bacterium]